jgi:hypothetical protein
VYVGVPRPALVFLSRVDEAATGSAERHAVSWFGKPTPPEFVHECFRASSAFDARLGPVARFMLDPTDEGVALTRVDADADVTLQLVGIRFRSQSASLIWRVDALEESSCPPESRCSLDADGSSDVGWSSDEEVAPTQAECEDIARAYEERVTGERAEAASRVSHADALLSRLREARAAGHGALVRALAEVAASLDA